MKHHLIMALVASVLVSAAPVHADGAPSGPQEPGAITKARDAIDGKKFAEAETLLAAYVQETPKSADAWNLRGFAARKQGQMDLAETYYSKALEIDDEHTGALEYQGIMYLQTGRMEQARANLEKLDGICFFGCKEYDSLKKAIETGKGY